MKTTLTSIILLAFTSLLVYSQQKDNKWEVIDTAYIRLKYEVITIEDIQQPEEKTTDLMLLQIGKNISKYSDMGWWVRDSVRSDEIKKNLSYDINRMLAIQTGPEINIFKNYPKNNITTTDRIPFNTYRFEEPYETPLWTLQNKDSTVCGYICKKATTTFRGRKYVAWYANEIPISDGPWKFSGLPGLILKVYDLSGSYSFECVSIEKTKNTDPIYIKDRLYVNTTKQQFYKKQKEYFDNPGALLEASGMIKSQLSASAYEARTYNPIELSD